MIYNELSLLEVVKDTFGLPHNLLELEDEKLLHILTNEVRRNFSKYHPVEKIVNLDSSHLDGREFTTNRFIIPEELCSEILNVKMVLDASSSYMTGLMSSKSVGANLYDLIDNSLMQQGTSRENQLTFKFQHPNILTVNERFSSQIILKVNTLHSIDFSTVGYNEIDILERHAKISVAKRLLGIRRKYGTFTTPLGEIQLDLETINELIQGEQEFLESERKVGNLTKRMPLIIA